MNLFELFVKIGVDDQASSQIGNISEKLGNGLKTAAKIGTAAVSAAAAGVVALTKSAVDAYAEYEQLVGGAELMFGSAFESVKKNAQTAYKTVQMSQNQYLKQVNGFATGLKTALGGNEQAAADLAHKIIQAEADIVAATGNSQEAIQNAFNGIMKSNFTMLDNLQIGITPTKEGFQEVIDKVNEWKEASGEATDYQMGNLADMQSALVDYIEMIGMSGYAQMEASKTISGSIASVKAAYENLITGIADDNADFEVLITNFVDSVGVAAENILPRVGIALNGVIQLVEKLFPVAMDKIPDAINEHLPRIAEAAVGIIDSLISGIDENKDSITGTAVDVISFLAAKMLEESPDIVDVGLDILVALANGIVDNLDELSPVAGDTILKLVDELTNEERLSDMLGAALTIIQKLADGFASDEGLGKLKEAAVKLLYNLLNFITSPETIPKIIETGSNIGASIAGGLSDDEAAIEAGAKNLSSMIAENLLNWDWSAIGKAISNMILRQFWTGVEDIFGNASNPTFLGAVLPDFMQESVLGYIGNQSELYGKYGGDVGQQILDASENLKDTVGILYGNTNNSPFVSTVPFGESGLATTQKEMAEFFGETENDRWVNVEVVLDGETIATNQYPYIRKLSKQKGELR